MRARDIVGRSLSVCVAGAMLVLNMPVVPVALASGAGPVANDDPGLRQIAKTLASDGSANDLFGCSVAISGDIAVMTAPFDDDRGTDSGSAYVFTRSGATWVQQAKLTASDGAAGDSFGMGLGTVAVSGDTIVVGAMYDDDGGTDSGSAYVFTRSGTTWVQQAKLTAADGDAGDWLGGCVAISGETVVVGAHAESSPHPGSAYVFTRSGTTWTQQAKLTGSDPGDDFGLTLAISGDTVLVGAVYDDDRASNAGAVYAFVRSGETWTQQAKLTASDGAANDYLGQVTIDGDTAVIGSAYDDDMGADSGSAYVFTRVGETWTQRVKLTASDGGAGDLFGYCVSLRGDTLAVGSPGDDDMGADSGSACVFTGAGADWTRRVKLTASDGSAGDQFGRACGVAGDSMVIGSWYDDDLGADSGSAYLTDACYATDEDTTLSVAAPGVLGNDTDAEGDPLTAELTGAPAHGDVALAADGSFTYTPDADWNGTDAFTYRAWDGTAYSAPATVIVRVVDRSAPAVADLVVSQTAADGCELSWLPLADTGSGLSHYAVYRDGSLLTATDATSITDSGLAPSTSYTYQVRAVDNAGNEGTCTQSVRYTTPVTGGSTTAPLAEPGTGVTVPLPDGGSVTFDAVETTGSLVTAPIFQRQDEPANFWMPRGGYYDIHPNFDFSGYAYVTLAYDESAIVGQERNLKLFHWKDNGWEDITVSVDTTANTITGRTTSFSDFMMAAPPSAYEQADVGITRTGTWTTLARTQFSGGTAVYASGANKSTTLTFDGTGIEWIGAKTTSAGKAAVYLDGVYQCTVDQYRYLNLFQQTMYSVHDLAYGTHTLEIRGLSTKNIKSTGYNTWVDAFRVDGVIVGP